MLSDIPFDEKIMRVTILLTIVCGMLFGIILISIGILNNNIILLLWGIAGISSVVIVLINPFKTYKILNILNIFLTLLSFNIPGIYYAIVIIVSYKIIHDNQEHIDKDAIDIDKNTSKSIKISTVISIVYMIIYISFLIIFFIYRWQDFYSFFTDNSKYEHIGLAVVVVGLFVILFRLFLIILMVLFFITPIIILYNNMLINHKALKYRELKYFKSLMIFGVLSLTFINSFAARKVIKSNN